jgi:antitoxin component of MazEF toxin-antitoxin module
MPVFESSRKVQVMGSSLAMTLPAMFVKANEVEKGSVMSVIYSFEGVLVLSMFEDYEVIKDCLKDILVNLEDRIKKRADVGEEDL